MTGNVNLLALKIVVPFIATSAICAAAEPIPFSDKFERLQKSKTLEEGLFQPGEKISAVYHIACLNTLRLLVNVSNGGAEHAQDIDIFHLFDDDHLKRELYHWQGRPIRGVVEVKRHRSEDYGGALIMEYDATLLQFEAAGPTNPTTDDIREMPDGAPVSVEGEIRALGLQGHSAGMTLSTEDGQTISVVLHHGKTIFTGDINSGLDNVVGKSPQVGDTVRLKGFTAHGSIQISQDLSTYLLKPSEARIREYQADRDSRRQLLANLDLAINVKDFAKARNISSGLTALELTTSEKSKHHHLVAGMPPTEQPVLWKDRIKTALLSSALGVNLNELTLKGFLELVDAWAERKTFSLNKSSVEAAYLFDSLIELNTPEELFSALARKAVLMRLKYFEDESLEGGHFANKNDWVEVQNLEHAIGLSAHYPSVETVVFFIKLARRIVHNESERWTYQRYFTVSLFERLKVLSRVALTESHDPAMVMAFRKAIPQLHDMHRAMQALSTEDTPVEKTLSNQSSIESKSAHSRHEYQHEMRLIEEIIESISL